MFQRIPFVECTSEGPSLLLLVNISQELKAARWKAPRIHETVNRLLLGEVGVATLLMT